MALGSVALMASVGAALDFSQSSNIQVELQSLADQSALAAASSLMLNTSTKAAKATAEEFISASAAGKLATAEAIQKMTIDQEGQSAKVVIHAIRNNTFGFVLGRQSSPIAASAVARLFGSSKICVLGLDPSASDTINLTDTAKIETHGCAVQANSTASDALTVWNGAQIDSATTCSAGGYRGTSTGVTPQATTDCPVIADPLGKRSPPARAAKVCDFQYKQVNSGSETLNPGVYCGGLNISTGATVKFSPGIYVMRDGVFQASNGSSISGTGVGFYLQGDNSVFKFNTDSYVNFTAPTDGDMAGLLFFADRASSQRLHQINSNNAHNLVGTIYLPNDTFQVSTGTPVADKSAYTAVVARKITLNSSPLLVLNADYSKTNVPVPPGIAGKGKIPMLVK
jgi:hypothetical protein